MYQLINKVISMIMTNKNHFVNQNYKTYKHCIKQPFSVILKYRCVDEERGIIMKNSSVNVIDKENSVRLINSIKLSNKKFAQEMMYFLSRYPVLTDEDIDNISDHSYCKTNFLSDYPMIKSVIGNEKEVRQQIIDRTGRPRYYQDVFTIGNNKYVFNSQLYGYNVDATHKDNRTPFYKWMLNKYNVVKSKEIDLSDIDPKYDDSSIIGKFDSWEIIDEKTAIKHCDKSFFEHNGSGVPKGILWFFDAENLQSSQSKKISLKHTNEEYIATIANISTDRQKVQIRWNNNFSSVLRPFASEDCCAIFRKLDIDKYIVELKAGEEEMTIKETIAYIKSYISSKGFNYAGDLIENFYLSLKSKPFVILAGTSGTGKTRLVKLFAEAIGAKMELVPVRPDWSDSSDLFGHNDLSNKFHPGAIIDFIKEANENKNRPYILCLDEMNLARVEYYLSDFLSIIETRDKNNGEILTDPLIKPSYFKDAEAADKYGQLYLPENLYVIGTVNMDETTFPFSKKVLDRANTIEFSHVDLTSRVGTDEEVQRLTLDNSFLKTEYLYLRDCDDEELINNTCFTLEEINRILLKANLHVGYRVRDEICFYMMNNKKADLLEEDTAFDREIMQKILPRIQGSSTAIKDALSELFIKCAGDYTVFSELSTTVFSELSTFEQMNAYNDSGKECKYPNSAKKIAFMMRRYEEDGFTSYWL